MSNEQAFNVLVQALSVANKAGVFDLKDSATVFQALGVLGPLFVPQEEVVEEKPVKDSTKK
jgi:hypothetical protein